MLCLIVIKIWHYQHLSFMHTEPPAVTELKSSCYSSHHDSAGLSTYYRPNTVVHAADPVSDHDNK